MEIKLTETEWLWLHGLLLVIQAMSKGVALQTVNRILNKLEARR